MTVCKFEGYEEFRDQRNKDVKRLKELKAELKALEEKIYWDNVNAAKKHKFWATPDGESIWEIGDFRPGRGGKYDIELGIVPDSWQRHQSRCCSFHMPSAASLERFMETHPIPVTEDDLIALIERLNSQRK